MEPTAHVIGLGRSGAAAARLLHHQGYSVTLSDRNPTPHFHDLQADLQAQSITVLLGHAYHPDRDHADLVVVSPGVPWDIPALTQARDRGLAVIGEMELAWRALGDRPWVGITGTNGKTTTTALTAALFQAAGFYAPACGNIGHAACELALARPKPDWIIAELSSYQIESSHTLRPRIGIWTTLTPDHLARHYTLDNYADIKASLLAAADIQILNGDDPYLRDHGDRFPQAHWTSIHGRTALPHRTATAYIADGWVYVHDQKIVEAATLRMVGAHNQQNLLMAVAAAHFAGISTDIIQTAIAQFPGVPHRLEHICTWQNIDFINDSKATNYDAAEVGLNAVAAPAILIAGGEAKAGDDTAWLKSIHTKAAAVLLIGDAAAAFQDRLRSVGYTHTEIVDTLDRAIPRSAELAQQHQAKVVLLSPACASFDQYPSFEHRGDHFRQLCQTVFG